MGLSPESACHLADALEHGYERGAVLEEPFRQMVADI
jgi:hypothetical protein